jgi:O-antigen ligase
MVLQRLLTPLDLPLALFILSGLIGVWVSYDPTASWSKFFLIVLAVGLYYLIIYSGRIAAPSATRETSGGERQHLLHGLIWVFIFGSAIFSIYFVTRHDYGSGSSKFEPLTQIGLLINRLFPPSLVPQPHPNNAAGVLELALPVSFALALHSTRSRARTEFAAAAALTLIIAFGVLMTASRGAWLALGLVGGAAIFVFFCRHRSARLVLPAALVILLTLFIAALRWGDQSQIGVGGILSLLLGNDSDYPRTELYNQVWHLIQDYPFTGSGLGVFPMVYSTYALLINVPFLPHAHNLFLQIWIEQGILGITAFAWLVVGFFFWAWRRRNELNWMGVGGVAAAATMLLHGLVDAPLAYSNWTLPLLFVPMAITIASDPVVIAGRALPPVRHNSQLANRYLPAVLGAGAVLLVTAGLIAGPARNQLAAWWYANLGSIAQTKVELGRYSFPDNLVEYTRRDCERRMANCDLRGAEDYFRELLALDSGSITANQRLTEIDLARGDYEAALVYGQNAYKRDADNPVTWQLLGDAYLALGRTEDAYAFWSRVSDAASKLEIEANIRYEKNGDDKRAGWAKQLAERLRSEKSNADQ